MVCSQHRGREKAEEVTRDGQPPHPPPQGSGHLRRRLGDRPADKGAVGGCEQSRQGGHMCCARLSGSSCLVAQGRQVSRAETNVEAEWPGIVVGPQVGGWGGRCLRCELRK